jgi:hypothetical protein
VNAVPDNRLAYRVRVLAAELADDRRAVEQHWRAARAVVRAESEKALDSAAARRLRGVLVAMSRALLALFLFALPAEGWHGVAQFLTGALVALLFSLAAQWSRSGLRRGRNPGSRGQHG